MSIISYLFIVFATLISNTVDRVYGSDVMAPRAVFDFPGPSNLTIDYFREQDPYPNVTHFLTGSELVLPGGITVWTGDLGLQIYEEIHENENNRALHVAFLPFVFYGIFRGIPALIGDPRSRLLTNCTVFSILLLYAFFYHSTGVSAGPGTVFANLPIAAQAIQKLTKPRQEISRTRHVLVSLVLIVVALVIQEVVGHSLWEEVSSRMTLSYIVNAILYSPVFFGAHYQQYYKTYPWSYLPVALFQIYDTYDILF